eukprot:TRINITY_DN45541_c0_g1_i1.p1 TRINITY_DN45541_c0_g1~~TRINITY_DN45541_c0_g1_i1.p1  ORF type:complete len:382 (+),score=36.27 TRINITY_DN45541_c0_g1_i1:75-1220(+)
MHAPELLSALSAPLGEEDENGSVSASFAGFTSLGLLLPFAEAEDESSSSVLWGGFSAFLEVSGDAMDSWRRGATWLVDNSGLTRQNEVEEKAEHSAAAGVKNLLDMTGNLCQALQLCQAGTLLTLYQTDAHVLGITHFSAFVAPLKLASLPCPHAWSLMVGCGVAFAYSAWRVFAVHEFTKLRDGGVFVTKTAAILWGVSAAHLGAAFCWPAHVMYMPFQKAAVIQSLSSLVAFPSLALLIGDLGCPKAARMMSACTAVSSALFVAGTISPGTLQFFCLFSSWVVGFGQTFALQREMTIEAGAVSALNGLRVRAATECMRAGISFQLAMYVMGIMARTSPSWSVCGLMFSQWYSLHSVAAEAVKSLETMNEADDWRHGEGR